MSRALSPVVSPPQRFQLKAGQSLQERLTPGTVLHVVEGKIDVTPPPQWLAESMFSVTRRLNSGSTYVVSARGWTTFTASADTILQVRRTSSSRVDLIAGIRNTLRRLTSLVTVR